MGTIETIPASLLLAFICSHLALFMAGLFIGSIHKQKDQF